MTGDEGRRPPRRFERFEAWYEVVAPDLTRRIAWSLGDPMLGREAAAEAFARAYERWSVVRDLDSPEGWVHRVAVNVCRRAWRRRALERRAMARTLPSPLVVEMAVPDDDVLRAVGRLPVRMRTAVRLRYWEDLTEREVAERMAVAPGTASAMLAAARRRLRREIGAPDPADGARPEGGPA
ncbi:MAG: RNA polymerase sigma factor [Kineosporiaceae bacterium]